MTFLSSMPESGVLVHVHGPEAGTSEHLESIDALRQWTPAFKVTRVQIFDVRPPTEASASFTTRPDGTHVSDLEGILSICTDVGNPAPSGAPTDGTTELTFIERHLWYKSVKSATL